MAEADKGEMGPNSSSSKPKTDKGRKLNYKDKLQKRIMSSDYFNLLDLTTTTTPTTSRSTAISNLNPSISSSSLGLSSSTSKRHSSQPQRLQIDYSTSNLSRLDDTPHNHNPLTPPILGKRKMKAIKKKLREKTKGPMWYGMTAPEITDDRKNDLEALRLRGGLDMKGRFYKRNTIHIKPKHFQVGKIVETKADFYNSRLTKKQRKRTIAEEFMAELHQS